MLRTLGIKTLTGVAQPIIGDVLTVAIYPLAEKFNDTLITVASTSFYQVGDRVTIDPLLVTQDTYKIEKILTATTMLGSLEAAAGHTHTANALIQLSNACGNVILSSVPGNAGAVVVGTDNTVTVNLSGKAIYLVEPVAAGVQPNTWQMNPNGGFNSMNTAEAWIIGTAGDRVLTYAWVF